MTTSRLEQLVKPIYGELERLTKFVPMDSLEAVLRHPLSLLTDQRITDLLPSVVLGKDGPRLDRLLLLTTNYLCEIKVSPQRNEFDILDRNTIWNYRFQTWAHEIKEGEVIKATFSVARVILLHSLSGGFRTEVHFAGESSDEREEWMAKVVRAFPVRSVIKS